MQKIKFFSKESSIGFTKMGEIDYVSLENEVNEYISENNLDIVDIQYKVETSGTITIASVMLVYREK